MFQICQEHENKIQRICLHETCNNRVLCLLCQHQHGPSFQSIMQKQSQSYKLFSSKINDAVDKYLADKRESVDQQTKQQQKGLIKRYFKSLRENFQQFLVYMQRRCQSMLSSSEQQDLKKIVQMRIKSSYAKVDGDIFKLLLSVYEGMDLGDIFRNNEKGKQEQLYGYLKEFHQNINNIMEMKQFKLKVQLPNLKILTNNKQSPQQNDYEVNEGVKKYEAKLLKVSSDIVDSIISDSIRVKKHIFTTSYDKTLRIYNEQIELIASQEYQNILNKIHAIADQVYTIAQSKDILIQNITFDKQQINTETLLQLRGHPDKIHDLHSLNTRIIASSCSQVVKIWDLYKERCQFTLKETANPTCIRFLPASNSLVVGYNNHLFKIFSIQTMKMIKKYELPGLPLLIDEGKNADHIFYGGTFKSNLLVMDSRLSKIATCLDLKKDAITCIQDSTNDSNCIAAGDRSGNATLLDLRTNKIKLSWEAHHPNTNLSKPRGMVGIYQEKDDQWITVGCNDKCLKAWEVSLSIN